MSDQIPVPAKLKRHAWGVLIVMALCLPLVLWGAVLAMRSTSNDPRQWLPSGFGETDRYDWFQSQFGTDEAAIVSWDGCTVGDERATQLAAALEASPFFSSVLSGGKVVSQLTDPPVNMRRRSALRRLSGSLIGPDGQTTCLVATTAPAGQASRRDAVAEIERQARLVSGLEPEELYLAGPTVDAAAIDAESQRLLFQLAAGSALVSFIVALLRLRSIRMAVIILAVAAYSTAVALALLYTFGGVMNLLMTMLPPLVYVLCISSAVHLANYYFEATRHCDSTSAAIGEAIRQGWLPCVLAVTTTSIGLCSLALSSIEPIREFGIFSAVGIIASAVVLLVTLPAALLLFPPKSSAAVMGPTQGAGLQRTAADFIARYHVVLAVGGVALAVFFALRLPHIRSTVRLQDRFLSSSDLIGDYRWLEENVGPMVPLEILIHVPKSEQRTLLQQLQLVADVQRTIRSLDEPFSAISAVNISRPLPRGNAVRDVVARRVINSPKNEQRLVDMGFLRETDDERLWRITVRAGAIGDLDYGHIAERLRESIDPLLKQSGHSGTYTGIIPLIYKAQRLLLQDLFKSFLVAFAVIGCVLAIVLRSVAAAALTMIPNVFPAVVIFGGLEWLDIPVQIGSVMTASAALGIAVDDTVHFLTWFHRGLDAGLDRTGAVRDAFHRCSGAVLHTTMICASGLLVFAASSFVPILHFAWLMVFLLVAAVIGDLVLLPAILIGPLGALFERARRR